MAERGTEKMTEWLDIQVDTLSSEERLTLISRWREIPACNDNACGASKCNFTTEVAGLWLLATFRKRGVLS